MKTLRNATIGALIAAVPLTSSIAATRPNAAVPIAGSAASSAATTEGFGSDHSYNWVAFALGIAAIALFALLVLDDNGDDDDDAVSAG